MPAPLQTRQKKDEDHFLRHKNLERLCVSSPEEVADLKTLFHLCTELVDKRSRPLPMLLAEIASIVVRIRESRVVDDDAESETLK